MKHVRFRRLLAMPLTAAIAIWLAMVVVPTAAGAPDDSTGGSPSSDTRHVGTDVEKGKRLPLDTSAAQTARRSAPSSAAAIGDTLPWLGLDNFNGKYYPKDFTLRGQGDKIEVWVADDRAFPNASDCRNQLNLTDVTDAQVQNFITQFQSTILPKESRVFSVAPARDGSNAILPGILGLPADTYVGQGDRTVVLVDNVRDQNYYDPTSPNGKTFIGGFFSSALNAYFDRNVMTIDSFDWLHRTGANPPDGTSDPAYQACAAALGRPDLFQSRPYGYEGTFAHEYQHLLESYEDADEVSWINEGLSDWAQTLVGYVDPSISPGNPKADGHLKCFMGYQDPSFGGPENSLTNWEDQGAPEILCDYGAAYSIMEYLSSHFGNDFMTFLHRDDRNGLASLDAALARAGASGGSRELLHDWAAAMAVDHRLDLGSGGSNGQYQAKSLSARINWSNPQAYSAPGAPPNGSDYVRLRSGSGNYLQANDINRISFHGAATLEPQPLAWTVDPTPPDTISDAASCGSPPPDGSGSPSLFSGCGANLDRAAIRQVSVPTTGAALSFDALWNTEVGWDFGFVQVSTDGGKTYTSLTTTSTTSEHDPGAIAAVVANLPGFTGTSNAWVTQQADLSAYAGKTILMSFRYITDPGVDKAGFWVRNVTVGAVAVPTDTVSGWLSSTQVTPVAVSGFTVQLVSYDSDGRAVKVSRLPLDATFSGSISGGQMDRYIDRRANVVAAIVMYDEPTELVNQQARYVLQVNQAVQPGG